MNPETENYTHERETKDTPFAETMQGGDKTWKQDGMEHNDSNRGSGQGHYQQDGNRTNDNQGGSKEQRKDEGNKGTTGTNR
jgi:hypothetical protein